jgi:hypothetical protein
MPDPSSAVLVHKELEAAAPATAAGRGRRGQAAAPGQAWRWLACRAKVNEAARRSLTFLLPAAKKSRSVRFGVVTYAQSSDDGSGEEGGRRRRSSKSGRGRKASRHTEGASECCHPPSSRPSTAALSLAFHVLARCRCCLSTSTPTGRAWSR